MPKVKSSRKRPHTSYDARERQTVREHKGGDHVINKGVKSIYPDIIKEYLKYNKITTPFYDHITKRDTPTLYKIFQKEENWPFDKATVSDMYEMKVPSGKKHRPDDNSILFGQGKKCLVQGVASFLAKVIGIIKNGDYAMLTPDDKKEFNQLREDLKDYIKTYYTQEEDGFCVDREAKEDWMKQPGNSEEKFKRCRYSVRQSINMLADANNPEEWLIYKLAKEISRLHSSATRSVVTEVRQVRKRK